MRIINKKPVLFEKSNHNIWTDPYIQQQILKRHLDFQSDEASRRQESVLKIVNFVLKHSKPESHLLDLGYILFVAVKPQFYAEVLEEIKDLLTEEQILVSIAPGKTLVWFDEVLGRNLKVIRTMPNTPSMVKEGMMGMCAGARVTDEDMALVRDLCSGFSQTEVIPEHLMDVVTAVSGSSPAYVFMFIEAMADAAVAGGMPRQQAYKFAAQAVLGSAKMVLETGKHPGELKDMVCSPAGTTIQAVRVLEEKGMRSSVIEAMMKCLDISRNM